MSRRSVLAAGGILAAIALVAGAALVLRRTGSPGGPAAGGGRDIAQSVGLDLPATADVPSQRRIETLRASAAEEASPAQLTVDYPQDQSIVPPELPPPTFLWHDGSAQADGWLAEVTFEGGA